MKQLTHTRYSLEVTDGETIELPFRIDAESAKWQTSPDGLTGYLGAMEQDDDSYDPFVGDEGEFYQFSPRFIHYCERLGIDEFKRIIRANPGRVFTHNGTDDWHGPGTVKCYPTAGPFTVADTRPRSGKKYGPSEAEDRLYTAQGYYIAPEDATDPAAYAKSALAYYSAYCNGDVYGAWCWRYTRPDTSSPWELDRLSRDSECWGFIGYDYACSERDARIEEAIAADKEA